jgi:phosphoenolpyruvate synthase/pyruvate phosphate dikinase
MKRDPQYAALVRELASLGRADLALVGGKNASLGEMIANLAQAGVRVPGGFATTADAYWQFSPTTASPSASRRNSPNLPRTRTTLPPWAAWCAR